MIKWLIEKIKDKSIFQIFNELRWISRYARRYTWAIVWYIILGVIGTSITLAASIVSKEIIDMVTGYRTTYVVQVAVIYITMQIVTILLKAGADRISAKIQIRVSQEMRADIFHKIMHAQWEPLSEYHSGDLLARSSRDTDIISGNIISWFPSLIINSLQFLGTFVILLWFDKSLAFLAIASAPITMLLSGFLFRRVRRHSKEMRQIGSETTIFHTEAFRNIRLIKAYHAIDTYCDKLSDLQKKQKDAALDFNKFSVFTSSFMSFVGMVIGGICFLWSAFRLWKGFITFGEMTLFLQMSGSLSGSFGALISLVPTAINAATAAGRIMDVTQLPAEDVTQQEIVTQILESGSSIHLQAENIHFAYQNRKKVIQNAHFYADAGEIVAVVGPSGGGKTTLLRLFLGMLNAQDGEIQLSCNNPKVVLDASPSTRRLFAYVPQDNTLFSGTIAENLRITNPKASDEMLHEALKSACADQFVDSLPSGIHTRVGEGGNKLSKGQIQRIAIARALLSEAPILLLDEATSALDVKTERDLLENIISNRNNRTCIVTTHKPSVLKICQRAYLINDLAVTPMSKEKAEELMKTL